MSAESRGTGSRETPVDHIIADFLEADEAGRQPDPQDYLDRFPQFADELRSFFSGYCQFQGLAGERPPHAASTGIGKSDLSETKAPAVGAGRKRQALVPKVLGRYRLQRLLGKGAMGAVFLAEDTQIGRRVALKVPTLDLNEDPTSHERFCREARAAALLRHPNICAIFDVGEAEGFQFIAMAYVAGVPLSKFVNKDKPLALRKAAVVVKKLALAMEEAHQAGIVHRDLKPANIMINEQGEPIVMDFGLARLNQSTDDVRITRTGMIVGSPAYMSPEQVTADHEAIGPSADIYSLGVMLYELLTGQLPFTGHGKLMALVAQIQRDPAPPPSTYRADIPPDLEAICLRMLAKLPEDRPASMNEVARALSDFLAGRSSAVDPTADTQPLAIPASSDAVTETMEYVFSPHDIMFAGLFEPEFAGDNEMDEIVFAPAESSLLESEGKEPDTAVVPNESTPELPSTPNMGSMGVTDRSRWNWWLRVASILLVPCVVWGAFELGQRFSTPAPQKTASSERIPQKVVASPPVAKPEVQPVVKQASTPNVVNPRAEAMPPKPVVNPPPEAPVAPGDLPRPDLVFLSAPRRSSLAGGGIVLHLGVRNESRFPRGSRWRAQVFDHDGRLLSESTLTDAADLRGRIVVKLASNEKLPERIRLKLIDVEKETAVFSDFVSTTTVSGVKTAPIRMTMQASRGLHDDLHVLNRSRVQHNGLTEMTTGRHLFGGVQFDIEDGVIELQAGSTPALPVAVFDLRVEQSFSRLHFLLACPVLSAGMKPGMPVAHCRVNYKEGEAAAIPINYGVHVENWFGDSAKTSLDEGTLAWIGANRDSLTRGATPQSTRLFVTSWTNPQPETPIDSLDILSDKSAASLVCVAIAGEPLEDAGVFTERVEVDSIEGLPDGGAVEWQQAQRESVEWALSVGAVVFISGRDVPVANADKLPTQFGVTSLSFDSTKVTDDDLARLRLLTKLSYLKLERASVRGGGLKHLARLPELSHLVLAESQIEDEGLNHLESLPALTQLELQDTEITDLGLKHLARCARLEQLRVRRRVLTETGVSNLKTVPKLNSLWCDADDAALKRIVGELNLTELTLQSARVSPAALSELTKMSDLRKLTLFSAINSTNAVKAIGKLSQLRQLRISGLSKSEILQLRSLLPNCQIEEVTAR